MPLIENDDMIQAVSADGTDQALNERILPRRARRRDDRFYTQALDPSLHGFTIDAISVSQQIAWCGIKRKGFDDLLGCPLSGGMLGHVEVLDLATVMAENDEHIKHTEGGGRDGEEINGDQIHDMVVKERPPALRWRFSITRHVLRDRGLRDLNAQLEQLTVDSRSAPSDVR